MEDFDQFEKKHHSKDKKQILREWYDWRSQAGGAMGAQRMSIEILSNQNKALAEFIVANGLEMPIELKLVFTQQHFEYWDKAAPKVKELADQQGQRYVTEMKAAQGKKGGIAPKAGKSDRDDRDARIHQLEKKHLEIGTPKHEIASRIAREIKREIALKGDNPPKWIAVTPSRVRQILKK